MQKIYFVAKGLLNKRNLDMKVNVETGERISYTDISFRSLLHAGERN